MELSGLFSGLLAGIVIGAIARILVPTMQSIGCLVTVIIGILGGLAGEAIGASQGWGFWPTFLAQVLIAVFLVAITASLFRRANR